MPDVFRSPGIDSKETIPPDYEACRAGTSTRVVVPARHAGNRFLGSPKRFTNLGTDLSFGGLADLCELKLPWSQSSKLQRVGKNL